VVVPSSDNAGRRAAGPSRLASARLPSSASSKEGAAAVWLCLNDWARGLTPFCIDHARETVPVITDSLITCHCAHRVATVHLLEHHGDLI
jgi:hypothetical protein